MAFTTTFGSASNAVVNTRILDPNLRLERNLNTYFSKMTTEIKKGERVLSNVVFEKREFVEEGRDSMIMTLLPRLKNEGTYGNKQMIGNEEGQKIEHSEVRVNVTKHAVASDGRASDQRSKVLKSFQNAQPQLGQWFGLEEDFEHFRAVVAGASRNLTTASSRGGIAYVPLVNTSHPNLFVAGVSTTACPSGLVLYNDTASNYESNAGIAITQASSTGGVTGTSFSLQLLDRMIPQLEDLEINPIMVDGKQMYVVVLHTNAWQQAAEADANWFSVVKGIQQENVMDNPIFTGMKGIYKGQFIIHVSPHVPGVVGTTPVYGTTTPHTNRDSNALKCNLILGEGALLKGVGEDLRFDRENQDYNNFEGIQASEIWGVTRRDRASDLPSGLAPTGRRFKNTSSAVLVTHSGLQAVTSA